MQMENITILEVLILLSDWLIRLQNSHVIEKFQIMM